MLHVALVHASHRHFVVSLGLVACFAGCVIGADAPLGNNDPVWTSPASGPGYDIILVAGQSNAVGFGCGPYTPEHTEQDPLILQIKPDLTIVPASDPLWHFNGTNKVGFGMAFARFYASEYLQPGRQVLIVPVARGSTSIIQWNSTNEGIDFTNAGTPYDDDTTTLWNGMITRLHAALAAPGTNVVVAVLWQQGENDYNYINNVNVFGVDYQKIHPYMSSPATYRQRLESLAADLRSAVPAAATAPFIRGEIPHYWDQSIGVPNASLVASFNQAIADAAISNSGVASTWGLLSGGELCNDAAHFNAMSQTELGRRFFGEYRRLRGAAPVPVTTAELRVWYVAPSVDMTCTYFNPDSIRQLSEDTIRWLATLMPSGLTLHEQWLLARQNGYWGAFGQGGHSAWLATSSNLQQTFDNAVASLANADMSPSWPTFRDHHVAMRALGYQGLFLCGGSSCYLTGQCDSLGRRY